MTSKQAVVIGAGAREHALVRGLRDSGADVFAAPGNAGIGQEARLFNAQGPADVVRYFGGAKPLVVIGPEAPLAQGWADVLRLAGFPVVGPSAAASRLESSKDFAKAVMVETGIPTARSRTAHSAAELRGWVEVEHRWPQVLKQSGLAQGKGVVVAGSPEDARAAIASWENQPRVWDEGVLLEEHVSGQEVSVLAMTNGRDYRLLPLAQDYKRLTANPDSPNTGGMGAVAPVSVPREFLDQVGRRVFDPMMEYLTTHQLQYWGVLYAGLMITSDGPVVLEFNVRLGDPETQAVLPILDVDWYDFWMQAAAGEVPDVPPAKKAAVAVVMAAQGYPQKPRSGMTICMGEALDNTIVYHAGTQEGPHGVESHGGRVLTVVGVADTPSQARSRAYARIAGIDFPHSVFREDIGL